MVVNPAETGLKSYKICKFYILVFFLACVNKYIFKFYKYLIYFYLFYDYSQVITLIIQVNCLEMAEFGMTHQFSNLGFKAPVKCFYSTNKAYTPKAVFRGKT